MLAAGRSAVVAGGRPSFEVLAVAFDGYGLIEPAAAIAYGRPRAWSVVGIAAYLYGSDVSLCTGDPPELSAAGRAWLEAMRLERLRPLLTWELASDQAELGATQGALDAEVIAQCLRSVAGVWEACAAEVFVTNDSVVRDWPAVLAYFVAVNRGLPKDLAGAQVHLKTTPAEDLYGQASLFERLRAAGSVKGLWKAPDGTSDEPAGTLFVQEPGTGVTIGGVSAELDIATPAGCAWSRAIFGAVASAAMPVYVLGDKGPGVERLQNLLRLGGWLRGEGRLGTYDRATADAVRAFQSAQKITPADHCGPETWAALFPASD
jgi:hypothetical protein